MSTRAASALLALLALFPAAALKAEASPKQLRVEVISCVLEESAVDVSEMLAIARAELAPRELAQREGDTDGEPLLRVDACHEEHLILRALKPPGTERRIELRDVPLEQRPRVAALALAELVVVSLQQPAAAKPPPAPPSRAARELPFPDWSPVEERAEKRPNTIGVGGEARFFTDSLDFSFGPRLDFSFAYLDVSLLALFGHRRESLGEYRTTVVAVSPSWPFYRSRTRAQVALSIGSDLGLTWGSAKPDSREYGAETEAFAPFVTGFAQFALSGPLSRRTYGRFALLGGYGMGVHASEIAPPGLVDGDAFASVRRHSDVRATTQGPFAAIALGLSWAM